jgi:hypothetical protein
MNDPMVMVVPWREIRPRARQSPDSSESGFEVVEISLIGVATVLDAFITPFNAAGSPIGQRFECARVSTNVKPACVEDPESLQLSKMSREPMRAEDEDVISEGRIENARIGIEEEVGIEIRERRDVGISPQQKQQPASRAGEVIFNRRSIALRGRKRLVSRFEFCLRDSDDLWECQLIERALRFVAETEHEQPERLTVSCERSVERDSPCEITMVENRAQIPSLNVRL